MYKVKTMGYNIEGVHGFQRWVETVKDSVEIVSVNTTAKGMIFVTYKESKQ